jgi:catalase
LPGNACCGQRTAGETSASPKTGDGVPPAGTRPAGQLDRVRADSGAAPDHQSGRAGADNQNSLKVGLRGPTAMEDFILREKITHFDHERIPSASCMRGLGGARLLRELQDLSALTRAAPFAAAGKRTPVFVRFSTVAGERGSADTVRDVRGFAVKFYTDEGNWDLVGNNMPVFFIQDAMKFPDLVHAVKPEPHHGMPQAASAHDTFWDFVSLMPESTHMLMWHMSDRAIPRSYRTMQGFGVHTFRLVNARANRCSASSTGTRLAARTRWCGTRRPGSSAPTRTSTAATCGSHRSRRLSRVGTGPADLHRRTGRAFPFDARPTKIVPEELVPVRRSASWC